MLRINVIGSAAQAKTYFGTHLTVGDYYAKDQAQEIAGQFGGKGAERMGLSGKVNEKQFFDLCDHKNPVTGERLTQRSNPNRRVGYDFTYSVPKSVSAAMLKDERVMRIYDEALQESLAKDVEPNIR